MRRAAAVLGVTAVLLVPAAPAAALPILDEADAQELVDDLAEAGEAQGVCYGWAVTVRDEQTRTVAEEVGSSTGGVGVPVDPGACARYAYLAGTITYTSASSEYEDSAQVGIESQPELAGVSSGIAPNDLLGEADDLALAQAVSRLPLLMIEAGLADPVPVEAATEPLPEGEAVSPASGSDGLRQSGPGLVLGAVVTLAGLAWLAYEVRARRASPGRASHVR